MERATKTIIIIMDKLPRAQVIIAMELFEMAKEAIWSNEVKKVNNAMCECFKFLDNYAGAYGDPIYMSVNDLGWQLSRYVGILRGHLN